MSIRTAGGAYITLTVILTKTFPLSTARHLLNQREGPAQCRPFFSVRSFEQLLHRLSAEVQVKLSQVFAAGPLRRHAIRKVL